MSVILIKLFGKLIQVNHQSKYVLNANNINYFFLHKKQYQ